MRSVLLSAAAALAGAAAGVVVPASPAFAGHCAALALPPRAVGGQSAGEGHLRCATPGNLTIMVCVEALRDGHWRVDTCDSGSAYGTSVGMTTWACVQDAPLVRTYVLGTDGNGEYVTATSVPALPGIGSCGP